MAILNLDLKLCRIFYECNFSFVWGNKEVKKKCSFMSLFTGDLKASSTVFPIYFLVNE